MVTTTRVVVMVRNGLACGELFGFFGGDREVCGGTSKGSTKKLLLRWGCLVGWRSWLELVGVRRG